jgi:hypothetical protein
MEVVQAGLSVDAGRSRTPEGDAVAAVCCCRVIRVCVHRHPRSQVSTCPGSARWAQVVLSQHGQDSTVRKPSRS